MTNNEKNIAKRLRQQVEAIEPIKTRGTLKEYFTVYSDKQRGDGDYSRSFATALYQKYGFEYCILLEVMAGTRG